MYCWLNDSALTFVIGSPRPAMSLPEKWQSSFKSGNGYSCPISSACLARVLAKFAVLIRDQKD